MPMNSRLLRPRASGVHPEAAAWRSAVVANGGTVSASTMKAVSTFCADIDKAGIRGRFWRLNLFAGDSDASLNAVRTPLYRGPSRTGTQYGGTTDTNLNFVQGDYAETGASGGLKGNGSTKSLNTEFATNNLSEGNRHISAYEILKATTTFDKAIGSDGAVGGPNSFYLATWTPASTYSFAFGNAGSTIQSVNYSGGALDRRQRQHGRRRALQKWLVKHHRLPNGGNARIREPSRFCDWQRNHIRRSQ